MLLLSGGGGVLDVFAKLVTGLYDSYLWFVGLLRVCDLVYGWL